MSRFEDITLVDEDGTAIDAEENVNTDKNELLVKAQDPDIISLLSEMNKQLKIMNLHLSILTDNVVNKTEVE